MPMTDKEMLLFAYGALKVTYKATYGQEDKDKIGNVLGVIESHLFPPNVSIKELGVDVLLKANPNMVSTP